MTLYQNEANYVYKNVKENKPIVQMNVNVNQGSSKTGKKRVRFTENVTQEYKTYDPPSKVMKSAEKQVRKGELEEANEQMREQEINPYESMMRQISSTLAEEVETNPENNVFSWSISSTEMEFPQTDKSYRFKDREFLGNTEQIKTKENTEELIDYFNNYSVTIKDPEDRFDQVKFNVGNSLFYDDSRDIGTTILGQLNQNSKTIFREEVNIPIDMHSYSKFRLIGGTKGKCLFDTGATKCYMNKQFYDNTPELHNLTKYNTRAKELIVGNGARCNIHFAICLQLEIDNTVYEIFTLVADIDNQLDLIIGIKNMIELESIINLRRMCITVKNRSIPIYPNKNYCIKPGEKLGVDIKIPFHEEIHGIGLLKLFSSPNTTSNVKTTIHQNYTNIKIINRTNQPLYLTPHDSLGVLDTRSLGYYNISQQLFHTVQQQMELVDLESLCYTMNQQIDQLNKQVKSANENNQEPFPWLEKDDWRRTASDYEILKKQINLKDSQMSSKEKKQLMHLCNKYKKAFSLRDEIGTCPNIKISINLEDPTPFFVRPFNISDEDKPFMDWQMERLVHLGILKKKSTSHTSPVMLISRKLTQDKRAVIDFRVLNSRVMRRNTTTPLMRDILNKLGKDDVEIMSCIDFKDAYHSLRLDEKSKEYCGIVPYFGAPCYRYERVPMGLSISPAMWIEYVNILLDDIENRDQYIAIMDDMLLFGQKCNHMEMIENLLKTVLKHGLKISPRKCSFFMTSLVYMGNVFKTEDKKITVQPIKDRTEAIQKLSPPTNVKGCKRFCGMVNYLAMFCPNLQLTLQPIYDLTRKGKVFKWTSVHQEAFDKVKKMLINPPVLSLPRREGRLTLYTDTSKTHTGSAMWQTQDGQKKLIGYASKSLPSACQNYSATELEMKGLLTGLMLWKHVIGRKEIDAAVDHKAVEQIMKAKTEPANRRIMKLLEALQQFNFKLYYIKGKDMHLADFLSRADYESEENPYELIPISLNHTRTSQENIMDQLWLNNTNQQDYCLVSTRSKTRQQGNKLPEVHGVNKGINPNLKPEKQPSSMKPTRRKQETKTTTARTKPTTSSTSTRSAPQKTTPTPIRIPRREREDYDLEDDYIPRRQIFQRETKPSPTPTPPPVEEHIPLSRRRPKNQQLQKELHLDNPEEEDNIEEHYREPTDQDFIKPPPLSKHIKLDNLMWRNLPRQRELDKIMEQVETKILRQTHLPTSLKDIKAHYLKSPHFKDLFLMLSMNRAPAERRRFNQINNMLDNFFLLDGLLFRYQKDKADNHKVQLCIPTSMVDLILHWFHSSIIGAHMGITKCMETINQRYFIPDLAKHLRAYIIGCHQCQLFKQGKRTKQPFKQRINLNTPSLSRFSMDIKYMPTAATGHKYILVCIDEVTNYLITSPLKSTTTPEICYTLINKVFAYFGTPSHIICDKDPAFLSDIARYLYEQADIKIITASPTNHQSLKAEHGIKSIADILKKHLTGLGKDWPDFLPLAMLSYNSFSTPNLDKLSPMELAIGRKAKIIPELEIIPDIKISATHKEYYERLKKQLHYLRMQLERFRNNRVNLQNKDREPYGFIEGQIVYLYQPKGAMLQTGTRKIACHYVGPLVIYKALSDSQFLIMSLDGKLYPYVVEESRLKPGYVKTGKGTVSTLGELQQYLRRG